MIDVLLPWVLAGDRAACRALVDQLTPVFQIEAARALQRAGRAEGRDVRQEVTDLTQEVFLHLFERDGRALREWRPDGGRDLTTYLRVFARFQIASLLRTQHRNPYTEKPVDLDARPQLAPSADPEGGLVDRQALLRLRHRAEEVLSDVDLLLYQQLFVREMTPAEVAAELGVSLGLVHKRAHRLRQRLLRLLD